MKQLSEAEIRGAIYENKASITPQRKSLRDLGFKISEDTAIWALEKQLPKEAKTERFGGKQFLICECGHNARLTAKYCDECGQAIRKGVDNE